MTLITFKLIDGRNAYVNPEHITLIVDDECNKDISEISLLGTQTLRVKGNAEDITNDLICALRASRLLDCIKRDDT